MRVKYLFLRRRPSEFKPVVLVTGCASGIGLALAELLHNELHYRVVVTARKSSLEVLRKQFQESDRFLIRTLDVTVEEEREQLVQEITSLWGGINILVNNAGLSYRAVVEHMTEKEEQHQFSINYFGPVGLIRAVLPHMRRIGRGKIINVSSVSGMLAMPTMGSYSASKYALEGLSESLWYEVRPFGIDVSLIQPGFVHSKSFMKVQYTQKSSPDHGSEGLYADYYRYMTPFIARLMNLSLTTPDDIAKRILRTIRTEKPHLWIPATLDAMFFYYLRRFVPRKILMRILFAGLPKVRKWGIEHTHRRR